MKNCSNQTNFLRVRTRGQLLHESEHSVKRDGRVGMVARRFIIIF